MPSRARARTFATSTAATAAIAAALVPAGCGGSDGADPDPAEGPPAAERTDPMPVEPDGGIGDGAEAPGEGPAAEREGGSGEAERTKPLTPAKLIDIVGRFLTSGDPAVACREVVTEALVRRSYGDRSGCAAAQVPGSVAEGVRVSDIEIAERTASATARPRGGVSDGTDLEVTLVRSDRGWLIDTLEADVPVGP